MDPMFIMLLGLLAVMVFFTWRNSKKRKAEAETLQSRLVVGAQVMTQHGIYGELISLDDENNEAIIESTPGTLLRLHRQTISRVVDPTPDDELSEDPDTGEGELADGAASGDEPHESESA